MKIDWDHFVISDDTEVVFKEFNEIYNKDREAARYYMINKSLSSNRIVVFIDKNRHIIVNEKIKYGVSITLKRYKSTKTINKFFLDVNNGSISKCVNNKFIACKPLDIPINIREYIINKIKWISFVFELNLPVTFNTIVTKKLYSKRKLLSWYWCTNYPTALKLNKFNELHGALYTIRKNTKNIKNLNNTNDNFFDFDNVNIFIEALNLAIKTMKVINMNWSKNRFKLEIKKMNRLILDKVYNNYDKTLKINEKYLPFLKYIKYNGFFIPKTERELSKICNTIDMVESCSMSTSTYGDLIIKRNNIIFAIRYDIRNYSSKKEEFFICSKHFLYGEEKQEDKNYILNFIININNNIDMILRAKDRKDKIENLKKVF